MKYIWCNIKNFYLNKKLIFFITIISVICSGIMIHFAYGLYQNFQLKKVYDISDQREVVVKLQDSFEQNPSPEFAENGSDYYLLASDESADYVTLDLLKQYLTDLGDDFMENVSYIHATAVVDDLPFHCDFSVKNGEFIKSAGFEKYVNDNSKMQQGRFFTEEEYRNGERVAINWHFRYWTFAGSPVAKKLTIDENTMRIQNKIYKVIGYSYIDNDRPTIPISSLDEDTPISEDIIFYLDAPIRKTQYDFLVKKTRENLKELAIVEGLSLPSDDAVYLYNTIILITIFIAIVSASNFAILYRYILSSRKQSMMVYRICGMSFWKVVCLYLGECIFLTIPAYLTGLLLFRGVVLNIVSRYYEYMSGSLDISVYLVLFGIYIVVSLIILTTMIVHALRSDADLKVKGGFQ
ncbi:MAG: ABC transporter permease [Lachnospiraceae bacterium]|nr:ABC transporter permease [Lachnospiraceae bacterium]